MPFSVLKSRALAGPGPRYQPAKPGRPAAAVEVTSLTRIWKFAQWRRRVAPQAELAGSGVFFSGWPSACMNRLMVCAEFVPNLTPPTPSAASTICSLVRLPVVVVGAVDVVVGADVVVVVSFLPPPLHAAPA